MIIELIENKEPKWQCTCTGNYFDKDIKDVMLCISIDNKQISTYNNLKSKLALQFGFTKEQFASSNPIIKKWPFFCPKCNLHPWRIVRNPLLKND